MNDPTDPTTAQSTPPSSFLAFMPSFALLSVVMSISRMIQIPGKSHSFLDYSAMFDADVKLAALAVVCPLDAEDVSHIRDMPQPDNKGKKKAGTLIPDDISGGSEHPSHRRRLDIPTTTLRPPQISTSNSMSSSDPNTPQSAPSFHSSISMVSMQSASSFGASTAATAPPSPPASPKPQDSPQSSAADPFGYLDDGPSQNSVPSTSRLAQSIPGSMFASPGFLDSPHNILAYATPIHTHAYITFGAGMTQKEIDQFSAANPLEAHSLAGGRSAIPYHIPFAAHPVGSAVMLLGGFGFLGRLHGLSMDNLVEAEVVLADGRIVIASEKDHPDLWWALRGAGPAFGIVTRYKAKAFPVPVVFAGNLIYRFHRATAPSLIKHFRDCVKGAPHSLVVIQMCYVGPKVKGQEFLQAISSWDGERCLLNEVDEKSFLHQQDSVAQVLRGKAANKWFIRSALINSLPDEIVSRTVLQFAKTPVGCTWLFELAGGALVDFENSCLPKSQRQAAFTVAALHQWDVDFEDPRCAESAEEWIAETLAPVTIGGPLPSFLGRYEPPGPVIACFGENWTRLREVKQIYDPGNFFRNSFWPLDSTGHTVDPEEHEPERMQL
ncbi:hypothetical protein BU15DRAFT_89615 [Melanogaster broomeanus]|nr:hypothetical protein BU15DRAFT_89615 [Melanogaster broomeanus]